MDLLNRMRELRADGLPFVLATVVRVERPTSARPGAKAIITQDGALTGWIGGSCTEPHIIREAAQVLEEGSPRLVRLCPPEKMRPEPEEGVSQVKITCMSGGTLEIYLEPYLPRRARARRARRPPGRGLALRPPPARHTREPRARRVR